MVRARLPTLTLETPGVSQLELRNLSKTYSAARRPEVRAVIALNLAMAAGELVALVGPSGCGKTTTLRLIAGLEAPDAGEVALDGKVVNGVAPKDRDVAMVFQRDALLPHLTAAQNLAFGLELRRVPRLEISQRVTELAVKLGVTDCLARKPGELSGGQRQRVALGRALVRQPKVLLLDEPFANLDAPLRRELRRELLRLHREQKLTTILVTHDQAEAFALGQRLAVMNQGRLEQLATPTELRAKPATKFVADFLDPSAI